MRRARTANRRRWTKVGAVVMSLGLVAAACSDKKDETSVGGEESGASTTLGSPPTVPGAATTTAGGEETTPSEETTAETTATEETTATDETTDETTATDETTDETTEDTTETTTEDAPPPDVVVQQTLPPPEGDPVIGGRLVVAGEAEVGNPWTPTSVQCDSYCQMRIRTFFEPLFVADQNLEVQGYLGESIEPNEDATVWTIKVREGISFTDGTPLNADAVIDNLNRTFAGVFVSGAE